MRLRTGKGLAAGVSRTGTGGHSREAAKECSPRRKPWVTKS